MPEYGNLEPLCSAVLDDLQHHGKVAEYDALERHILRSADREHHRVLMLHVAEGKHSQVAGIPVEGVRLWPWESSRQPETLGRADWKDGTPDEDWAMVGITLEVVGCWQTRDLELLLPGRTRCCAFPWSTGRRDRGRGRRNVNARFRDGLAA